MTLFEHFELTNTEWLELLQLDARELPLLKVYIASPYTLGDVGVNVRNSLETFNALMDLGFVPFSPLLSHFCHIYQPRHYDEWLTWCLEWVKVCDVLLRLPGESAGADREVELAEELEIPVCHNIEQLVAYRAEQDNGDLS